MWARLLLGNVKSPLSVDVGRSKTPLLKFSIGKYFSLSQVTIPEVFTKVNSTQFSYFSKIPMSQGYGHPQVLVIPIPKILVIWASPVTLTLTQIGKVIWEGDIHITRVLGIGMPKTRGCPYHCDTGLLPQKRKRDLNGEQSCTVTVIKEVYSSSKNTSTKHKPNIQNKFVRQNKAGNVQSVGTSTSLFTLVWCLTVYISSREGFLVIAANKNKDKHKGIPTEFNFPYTVEAIRLQSRYRFARESVSSENILLNIRSFITQFAIKRTLKLLQ